MEEKQYKRNGFASEEHENSVDACCLFFRAKKVYHGGKGYFPDASNEQFDIEVEKVPESKKIKTKKEKWENGKRKILVLTLSKEAYFFDEGYIISKNGDIIRLF